MSEIKSEVEIKKTPFDVFVDGARKGWAIATTSTIPNVLMAFVIIQLLKLTGLLDLIASIFNPVMALFGLPGEAVTVLVAGWLSMGGGTGVAAMLYSEGLLSVQNLVVLFPAIYLMGSQVQYLGRVLGTGGVKPKYYLIMILISIINAAIALVLMGFFVKVM